jgi:hypothetical protein
VEEDCATTSPTSSPNSKWPIEPRPSFAPVRPRWEESSANPIPWLACMAEALSQSSPQTASCKPPEPPPLMTSRRDDLKHRHRLVLDTTAKPSGKDCQEHLVVGTGSYGRMSPIRPAALRSTAAALHLGWQSVWSLCHHPVGRTLRGAPWRLRTGHSARTRSRDQSPATTRPRVPETGCRAVRPATRKDRPNERRRSTASEQGAGPSSIEATIKINNATKKIVWPMSLSVPRAVTA